MSPQAKESIEKAAYTAVGAPVAAVKALNARISDLREAIKSSRDELSEDLAREFDVWVAEGEKVVNDALERLRKSETMDRARTTSQKVRERVSTSIEEMGKEIDEALDVLEPEKSLEMIKGIGPGYADRLNDAGIPGITAFVERTETKQQIAGLAEKTGFSVDQIEEWRNKADLSRISGVGESYQLLLHRAGIWTISQFAEADAADLAARVAEIHIPGTTEQTPGEDHIESWIAEAKKLDK